MGDQDGVADPVDGGPDGGDAQLIHLPQIGITGNTYFLFSDLNNTQIADQISALLAKKKLN